MQEKKKEKKRGYFVHGEDSSWGIAVVATTAREAKRIGFAAGEFIGDAWIDIRARWERDADVTGLDIGVLHGLHDGLLRGFFKYIEGVCEDCGVETELKRCNGKALCFECVEKEDEKLDHIYPWQHSDR